MFKLVKKDEKSIPNEYASSNFLSDKMICHNIHICDICGHHEFDKYSSKSVLPYLNLSDTKL